MANAITETLPGLLAGEAILKGALIMVTASSYPTVENTPLDTSLPIGVALADAASGEAVQYAPLDGSVRIVLGGGAITEGNWLAPDGANDGEVKAASAGDQVCGIANIEAGVDGLFRATMFQGWLLA